MISSIGRRGLPKRKNQRRPRSHTRALQRKSSTCVCSTIGVSHKADVTALAFHRHGPRQRRNSARRSRQPVRRRPSNVSLTPCGRLLKLGRRGECASYLAPPLITDTHWAFSRQGATVEELTAQVNKAKDAMDKVEGEWKSANRLNKALRTSLLIRLHRWQEFRSHISLRCKLIFSSHLAQRGYFGKVLFNHEAQTLTLRVCVSQPPLWWNGTDGVCRSKRMTNCRRGRRPRKTPGH